jgi:hypothetical protein
MAVTLKIPFFEDQTSVTAKGYSEAGSLLQSNIALTESAVPGLYTGSLSFATFPVGYYDMRVYIGAATVASASWAIRVTADGTTADYADSIGELRRWATNQTEHDATQAAVAGIGSGVGDFSTTINVKTSASQNIPGALVTIQQSGSIVRYGFTNSSGNVVLLVNAGSYTVNISMFGFSSLVGQAITVSANSTQNYQLTAVSPLPTAMPGLCNVRFEVINGRGDPVPAAVVSVFVSSDSQTTDDKLISQAKQTVTADANGIANLVMIRSDSFTRGGTYEVLVTESSGKKVFKKLVRVPALASCSAEDLILVSS